MNNSLLNNSNSNQRLNKTNKSNLRGNNSFMNNSNPQNPKNNYSHYNMYKNKGSVLGLKNINSEDENIANSNEYNTTQDDFQRSDASSFDRERPLIKRKKILILGAPGVGKSAVIFRFKDDVFKTDYIPTLQETYKKEFFFNNEKVELEINDLDGQNEFTIFSGNKFSFGMNAYILCYSVENKYSFQMIQNINTKLTSLVGDCIPKILIGNKADLTNKKTISTEEGKALAKSINASFLECSARSGLNIQLIFHTLLVEINKMESNIDLKNFSCSWLIRLVLRNLTLNNYINYILLSFQIVSSSFLYFILNLFLQAIKHLLDFPSYFFLFKRRRHNYSYSRLTTLIGNFRYILLYIRHIRNKDKKERFN